MQCSLRRAKKSNVSTTKKSEEETPLEWKDRRIPSSCSSCTSWFFSWFLIPRSTWRWHRPQPNLEKNLNHGKNSRGEPGDVSPRILRAMQRIDRQSKASWRNLTTTACSIKFQKCMSPITFFVFFRCFNIPSHASRKVFLKETKLSRRTMGTVVQHGNGNLIST